MLNLNDTEYLTARKGIVRKYGKVETHWNSDVTVHSSTVSYPLNISYILHLTSNFQVHLLERPLLRRKLLRVKNYIYIKKLHLSQYQNITKTYNDS